MHKKEYKAKHEFIFNTCQTTVNNSAFQAGPVLHSQLFLYT